MRFSVALILVLFCLPSGGAFGQGTWEFLGPGVGYLPEAFFVSRNAVYVGLSEQDGSGLGLYRYGFVEGQWGPFAWQGYAILDVTVWGQSDNNIRLIRYDEANYRSDVLRSSDQGRTWVETAELNGWRWGLIQAPSDSSRLLSLQPTTYSSDGGWSWHAPGGYVPASDVYDAIFDPSNALVAYLTGQNAFSDIVIHKSTDGGARWDWTCYCASFGIRVDPIQTSRVMGGALSWVRVTTDAGANWSVRMAPFHPKMVYSPLWAPGNFFAVGNDSTRTQCEVWRTGDFGESWSRCGEGLPTLPGYLYFTRMFLDGNPTQPVLYLALEGSGVWRWTYSGAGASEMKDGPDHQTRILLYPNPSSDHAVYGMRLPRPEHVLLRLFDSRGRFLVTLKEGIFPAGTHVFSWSKPPEEGHDVACGVYYLTLNAGAIREERKVVLLK